MAFTTTTGAGGTSLIGTSGVDTATVAGNSFPLYIGAQAANDVVVMTGSTASVKAELGKGADNFTAAGLATSTISGNFGNDIISISGTVTGSTALVNGNQGVDTITLTGSTITKGARVLGGADNDIIDVDDATISEGGIVNGNKGADTINFTAGAISNSTIFGGEGNDSMNATANAVVFSGDKGEDTLTGSTAADKLYGGDDNDVLKAGTTQVDAAKDTLSGGSGVDTFEFVGNTTALATTTVDLAGGLADIITDFTVGEDKIKLSAATAFGGANQTGTGMTAGNIYAISGSFSTAGAFTQASIANGGFDTLIAIADGGATVDGSSTVVLGVLQNVLATSVTSASFTV